MRTLDVMGSVNRAAIRLVERFPEGSIWESRYITFPAAIVISTLAIANAECSWPIRIGAFVGGLFSWTFLEYVLHRWVLHYKGRSEFTRALMKRLHWTHHEVPTDKSQVCIPFALSLVLWFSVYRAVLVVGLEPWTALLVSCGVAFGMSVYDITHYSTHYMKASNWYLKLLTRHHMLHHGHDETKRFGVTSPLWDYVFGTIR